MKAERELFRKRKGSSENEREKMEQWRGMNMIKEIIRVYGNILKLIIMCNQYMLVKTAKKIIAKLIFQTSYSYRLHQPWCSPKQGLPVRSCLVLSPEPLAMRLTPIFYPGRSPLTLPYDVSYGLGTPWPYPCSSTGLSL